MILVIENRAVVALDLVTRLEEMGYGIVAAVGSEAEAIEQVRHANPDVVLMDIRPRVAPVIYPTAHPDERTVERAKQTDPSGYILMPIQEQSLRVTIEMALQRSQSTDRDLALLPQVVFETDRAGFLTFCNQNAPSLFGERVEEAAQAMS